MMRFANDFRLPRSTRRCGAFTLIELLTVIGIILILAGLVLSLAGSAQNKAATSRANAEIQALSAAASNYQIDNGTYPRITSAGNMTYNTDKLYAYDQGGSATYDPSLTTTHPNYTDTSLILYQLLCGSFYIVTSGTTTTITYYNLASPPTDGTPKPTTYYPFKTAQLKNSDLVTSGWVNPSHVTAFIDPFGFSYGYSTAYQADVDAGTNPPTHGYNPTFDLWSTVGYASSGGKTYPSIPASLTAGTFYNTLWAKNW